MVHSDHETLLFLGFFHSIFRKAPQSREIENEKKIKKESDFFSSAAAISSDHRSDSYHRRGLSRPPIQSTHPLYGLSDGLDPSHHDVVAAHLCREFYCVPILERFILHEKVLYLVYGLRKSVRSCVWLALVLLSWYLIFNPKVDTSPILHRLSRALVAVLVWLLKILVVKVHASFYIATFFDRIKESVIHHYILETLSGEHLLDGSGGDDKEEENEKKTKKLIRRSPAAGMMVRSKTMPARVGGVVAEDQHREAASAEPGREERVQPERLVRHAMKTGLSLSTLVRTMDRFGNTEGSSRGEPLARLEEDVGTVGRAFIKSRGERGRRCLHHDRRSCPGAARLDPSAVIVHGRASPITVSQRQEVLPCQAHGQGVDQRRRAQKRGEDEERERRKERGRRGGGIEKRRRGRRRELSSPQRRP